jgi:hypothetical protein
MELLTVAGAPPRYSSMSCIDPLLECGLVLVFSSLDGEIVLLVQIEKLPSVTGRKVVPLCDSSAETAFLG